MMKLRGTCLVLSLLVVAVAAAEDWPSFHRDAQRTGVSAEAYAAAPLEVAWATQVDAESVDASPAVVGGRVYVGTALGKVVCLAADTGQQVWETTLGGAVLSSPAVAEGKVFVGSADRCLYALAADTGKTIWQVRTRGPVVASPLYLNGYVYCGSMDKSFRCVSAADGKELWRTGEQGSVSAAAAAAGDLIYYGDEAGNILARSCADGKLSWSVHASGGIVAGSCVRDTVLIVPVMSGTALSPPATDCITALDARNGTRLWAVTKPSSVLHTPVTDGTNVYFATVSGYLSDTELFAVGLVDGVEVWKRRLGGVADSSPLLAGEQLLFGNHDTKFYVVNKATGQSTQELAIGAKMYSSPALSEGRVYIGAQDGKVYCLKPAG